MNSIIRQAEKEVARILSQVEQELNCSISAVNIMDIDVTSIGDDGAKYVTRVEIEVYPKPNRTWEQNHDSRQD